MVTCEWQRWKPRGEFLDYNEVIVSCSQHGDQSGHDSEKDAKLEIIFWAPKPWRVKEAWGLPEGVKACGEVQASIRELRRLRQFWPMWVQ